MSVILVITVTLIYLILVFHTVSVWNSHPSIVFPGLDKFQLGFFLRFFTYTHLTWTFLNYIDKSGSRNLKNSSNKLNILKIIFLFQYVLQEAANLGQNK